MNPKYTILVPMKDEEENVRPLLSEVEAVMSRLGAPWEMICVNDGSRDRTGEVLAQLAQEKPFLRVLTFTRNFGQSSAFDAGFSHARGEFLITLDGDRQNDPADIPKMVEAAGDCDLVCGIRAKRKDTIVKRVTSRMANAVRSRVCQDGISDTGCSLKVYRTHCLKQIKMFEGMHRFLPALFQIEGFKVRELPVNHRERTAGKTKYNFLNRSFNTVFDMFAVWWMRKRALKYQIDPKIS